MRKQLIFFGVITLSSLGFALTQTSFFLGFVNALGAFAIFSVLISGFIFLERFGYFDVFGYTFKKTYYVLTNTQKNLDEEHREIMGSMYNYVQNRTERRKDKSPWFYISTGLLMLIAGSLAYLYMVLNGQL